MNKRCLLVVGLVAFVALAGVFAAEQKAASVVGDFVPDSTFTGSTLSGWHTLGNADWKAQNGEITGSAPASGGGLLVSDKAYQDSEVFARFRCTGSCKTGVVMRLQKTSDGFKGVFVSLADSDLTAYRVTLSPTGEILTRDTLRNVGAFDRIAPPAAAAAGRGGAAGNAGRGGAGGRGGGRGASVIPESLHDLDAPKPGIHAGEWNSIEVLIDANIVRPYLNSTVQVAPGDVEDEGNGYGPMALWIGGSGQAQFKDVSFKDLNNRVTPKEKVSSRFRMQKIDDFYYGWGAAVADINRDGHLDVVSGSYVYLGPDFTVKKEIYLGQTYSPGLQFAPDMVTFAYDFTGDGWPDVLSTATRPMDLYVNPQGENRRWDKFRVLPGINSELVLMRDLDGDGKPEVIFTTGGALAYAKPVPGNPTAPWPVHRISETGLSFVHSMGVGDVNGDGRLDILQTAGWWEQPPAGSTQELWTYHPQAFGRWGRSEGAGGADMAVYDVNGDGLNDVVTGLNAHGFGLAWFEQKRDKAGNITFDRHMIIDDFSTPNAGGVTMSEMHASAMADIDGDGIPDYITGKRHFAHLDSHRDADVEGPASLYWFRTVRNPKAPGGAEFVPELIHNRSGVGSQFAVADLNKDGAVDIITASDKGLFIFWGTPRKARAGKAASAPATK